MKRPFSTARYFFLLAVTLFFNNGIAMKRIITNNIKLDEFRKVETEKTSNTVMKRIIEPVRKNIEQTPSEVFSIFNAKWNEFILAHKKVDRERQLQTIGGLIPAPTNIAHIKNLLSLYDFLQKNMEPILKHADQNGRFSDIIFATEELEEKLTEERWNCLPQRMRFINSIEKQSSEIHKTQKEICLKLIDKENGLETGITYEEYYFRPAIMLIWFRYIFPRKINFEKSVQPPLPEFDILSCGLCEKIMQEEVRRAQERKKLSEELLDALHELREIKNEATFTLTQSDSEGDDNDSSDEDDRCGELGDFF